MFGISAASALAIGAVGGVALSQLGGGSDQPDTSGMNTAALKEAELSKEQLDWIKQVYAEGAPDRAFASDTARKISAIQLEGARKAIDQGDDYSAYSKKTFRPVEERLVSDAQNFNTDAERERLAGLAGADVAQSFAGQRDQLRRDVGRAGVNPGDPGYTVALGNLGSREALATAQMKNKARSDARTVGRAQLMDAASLGRGLPGQQATSAQLALTSGNSAVGNANVPNQVTTSGAGLMNTGYEGARAGYAQSGNIYGNIARLQQGAEGDDSAMWGALGKVGGALIAGSDKNEKTDVKPVKGEIALAAARRMPVKGWKYRKGSVHNDGGKSHIGPMAQDVHAALGNKVAPNGKAVDLISLAGVTLSAVKALDKKVGQLEKRKA